jgi:hypothetical protein
MDQQTSQTPDRLISQVQQEYIKECTTLGEHVANLDRIPNLIQASKKKVMNLHKEFEMLQAQSFQKAQADAIAKANSAKIVSKKGKR